MLARFIFSSAILIAPAAAQDAESRPKANSTVNAGSGSQDEKGATGLDDFQDIMYLGESGPVLIRVHILVDGRGFRDAWRDNLKTLFDKHDTDGNGFLSDQETQQFGGDDRSRQRSLLASVTQSSRIDTARDLDKRHSGSVRTVVFSPGGRYVASGGDDKTARLWDLAAGDLKVTLQGHAGGVRSVAFSPDGRLLASGGKDGKVKLWSTDSGELQATLEGHRGAVTCVVFLPDGKRLASSSFDRTVRLWDVETGKLTATLEGHADAVIAVAAAPDGQALISGGDDGRIIIWDARTRTVKRTLEAPRTWSLAISAGGKLLAAAGADESIRLWNVATGELRMALEGHSEPVRAVAFSPDGKLLVSGSWDTTVRIWNAATGDPKLTIDASSDYVHSVSFSTDGKTIASAGDNRTIRYWDVETGQSKSMPRPGLVTLEQLVRWFEDSGEGPFSTEGAREILESLTPPGSYLRERIDGIGEELFQRLDADGDGMLAHSELAAAADMLRKLDVNDDETISVEELQVLRAAPQSELMNRRLPPAQAPPLFLAVPSGGPIVEQVVALIQAYAGSAENESSPGETEQSLGQDEIGLPADEFRRFDGNGDGQLGSDELAGFLRDGRRDVELVVRLGRTDPGQTVAEILRLKSSSSAADSRQRNVGRPIVLLADAELEFTAVGMGAGGGDIKQFYVGQFKMADGDSNDYLQEGEVSRNVYFRPIFTLLDHDSDGKVFEKELVAYIDERAKAASRRVVLRVSNRGHDLFRILDADGDARLNMRELSGAAKRMGDWDKDKDERLALPEIPRSIQVSFGPASPGLAGLSPIGAVRELGELTAGPVWFRKMDRNRDGDVSRREFLGDAELFERFDLNGDGLIDASEAQAGR